MKNFNVLEKIAEALLIDYISVYFIDAQSGEFQWFSVNKDSHTINLEKEGADFFAMVEADGKKNIHPDEREYFLKEMSKQNLLKHMTDNSMKSVRYRLMVDDKEVYHEMRLIRGKQEGADYFILGVIDIDQQMKEDFKNQQIEKERELYNQIAESLASNYDVIYYVNSKDNTYTQFLARTIYGSVKIREDGIDFYKDVIRNSDGLVHPEDRDKVLGILNRDYIISTLEDRKQISVSYRLVIDGKEQFTKLTIMWAADKIHFIMGVENIDEEMRKEMMQTKLLNDAKQEARTDELTGVKNKMAYHELESSIQSNLDNGINYLPFAIAICDLNNLKEVNDTLGHHIGDNYLKASCRLICDTFDHSPVFRYGGDEFIVFIRGKDYEEREKLVEKFHSLIDKNIRDASGPIVAIGMAEFDPDEDQSVGDVFEKADLLMYQNKRQLKEMH